MTQRYIFTPADPALINGAPRLRLFTDAGRTPPAVVDVGPAEPLLDGTWAFTFADLAPASYFATVTTSLVAGGTADVDTTIDVPLDTPAGDDDPVALWVTAEALAANPDLADASPAQRAAAARVATDVLFALSGRRWPGARSTRLRVAPLAGDVRVALPSPFGLVTGGRRMACACHSGDLDPQLPGRIIDVTELLVGDTLVPHEQIEVVDGRTIRVRVGADPAVDPLAVNRYVDIDGNYYCLFPSGAASCGRTAAVTMTVVWGTLPPEAGAVAALTLATEIAKGLIGGDCQIAGNITSVNRQGVSVLLDPNEFLKEGRTGVPGVDLWLASVNPHGLAAGPEVWWPESPVPERLA